MGQYGGYFKGEKKKKKKEVLEKEAEQIKRIHTIPQVKIIGKKGKR